LTESGSEVGKTSYNSSKADLNWKL